MIIQNTNQSGPPVSSVSTDTPKVASNTAKVESAQSPAHTLQQPPSPVELKNAIDVVNRVMQLSNHSLEFSVDSDTKKPVVKMVDTETGELIRQYPTEAMMAISRSIDQFQQRQGLLLKHKA